MVLCDEHSSYVSPKRELSQNPLLQMSHGYVIVFLQVRSELSQALWQGQVLQNIDYNGVSIVLLLLLMVSLTNIVYGSSLFQ